MTSATISAPVSPPPPQRQPNQLAQQITGRPYLSYSQVSLMRSSPPKFPSHSLHKATPDFQPSSLRFGGGVHSMLECWYRSLLEGLPPTPAAMLATYEAYWQREVERAGKDVPVRFGKNEDEATLLALAQRVIDAFLV